MLALVVVLAWRLVREMLLVWAARLVDVSVPG